MSLLFNMLSRLFIAFLPRSKRLLISRLQSPSAVILEPPNKISHCFHCFLICYTELARVDGDSPAFVEGWCEAYSEACVYWVLRDFILGSSKITADGDCSHKIKRHLLLGRKAMTNLDSTLRSRDITLPTKVRLVKAMVFSSSQV